MRDLRNYGTRKQPNAGLGEALVHSVDEGFDAIHKYDAQITELSRRYHIRKAMIQAVVLWEYWGWNELDHPTDLSHLTTGHPNDPTTGIAQIMAGTAICSRNWAVRAHLIPGIILSGQCGEKNLESDQEKAIGGCSGLVDDTNDPAQTRRVRELVWRSLYSDDAYNISTVPVVLLCGAAATLGSQAVPNLLDAGVKIYSGPELVKIFGRYNGFGDAAARYGEAVLGVYHIFEEYNSVIRG